MLALLFKYKRAGPLARTGPPQRARGATSAERGGVVCKQPVLTQYAGRGGPAGSRAGELAQLFEPRSHEGHSAEAGTSPGRAPASDHFAARARRHFRRAWRQVACSWPETRGSDPSAGSPTETLLRLLLPLESQVRHSSRRPADSLTGPQPRQAYPGSGPSSSLNPPIGSSDGRCVQRAGT